MNTAKTDKFHIFVVDDDREMRDSLAHLLTSAGWQVDTFRQASVAIEAARKAAPDVVLSDVRMPGMSGLELLRELHKTVQTPVVLISAHGDIEMAVNAIGDGAYSFIEKPFDPRRLLAILNRAAQASQLARETETLRLRLARFSGLDRLLLGDTPAIKALREEVMDLAEIEAPVMLTGETGTGKELVATALHELSPRGAGPFVAINCATLTEQNFEAIMFGDAAGNPGALQRADKGTLFLDEIGAWSANVQAKMLRVVEDSSFTPAGAQAIARADMRIISATNRDVGLAVRNGEFREDLFFRLNALVITIPPLRDRRDDIHLLFTHFLGQIAAAYEVEIPEMGAQDIAALLAHDWPGNIRELRHSAERRILAARRGRGSVASAIGHDGPLTDVPETLRGAVAALEKHLISRAVQAHQGRMDDAADALGIARRTLNEKIVKLGIDKSDLG